jgi:hypothetical protein
MTIALLARFLYLVAAAICIGGMLFVALVLVRVTRRIEDPDRAHCSESRHTCNSHRSLPGVRCMS